MSLKDALSKIKEINPNTQQKEDNQTPTDKETQPTKETIKETPTDTKKNITGFSLPNE